MVALRLVQGFCLGGELPGALTYVVETAPRDRAVRLRRGVRVRDDGRGGGDRRQPGGAHVAAAGARAGLRLAHRVHARRARRRAQLRAAAIARRVAGVRAHEAAWRRGSRSAKCCGRTAAGAGRHARCWRHGRLQRPVLLAHAGVLVRRAAATTRARRCSRRPSASSPPRSASS